MTDEEKKETALLEILLKYLGPDSACPLVGSLFVEAFEECKSIVGPISDSPKGYVH